MRAVGSNGRITSPKRFQFSERRWLRRFSHLNSKPVAKYT
jgi:hypothetical protein